MGHVLGFSLKLSWLISWWQAVFLKESIVCSVLVKLGLVLLLATLVGESFATCLCYLMQLENNNVKSLKRKFIPSSFIMCGLINWQVLGFRVCVTDEVTSSF